MRILGELERLVTLVNKRIKVTKIQLSFVPKKFSCLFFSFSFFFFVWEEGDRDLEEKVTLLLHKIRNIELFINKIKGEKEKELVN